MLIGGGWALSNDGVVRPVVRAEILAADNSWLSTELLVDGGADRTVIMASTLTQLALPHVPTPSQLGGVGGGVATVHVGTHIRFTLGTGGKIVFQGTFAAFTQLDALDSNVLGRDIMNLFAVIVDRPGDVVCLIGKGHRYRIESAP